MIFSLIVLLCDETFFKPPTVCVVPDVWRQQVRCLSTVAYHVPSLCLCQRFFSGFWPAEHSVSLLTSEEMQVIMSGTFSVESSLYARSPSHLSVSADRVISSSAHMQTLVFACFFLVVGVRGVSPAHPDCVFELCFLTARQRIKVQDEGTKMARLWRINSMCIDIESDLTWMFALYLSLIQCSKLLWNFHLLQKCGAIAGSWWLCDRIMTGSFYSTPYDRNARCQLCCSTLKDKIYFCIHAPKVWLQHQMQGLKFSITTTKRAHVWDQRQRRSELWAGGCDT